MTDTDLHVLLSHAQKLFPRSPWTPEEWAIFAKKLRSQPFELAREAIEEHRADTSFNSPSIPKVLDACRAARHQEAHDSDSFAKPRTADDVVGEIRWTWQAAVRMYGTDHAIRNFASSDATRHIPELLRLGWSQDQIDVVIQEITGGEVADSFRDHQRRLQDTWDDRIGVVVNRRTRKASARPLGGALPDAVREIASSNRAVELPRDREILETPKPLGGVPGDQGTSIESQDDNDLRPGTFIDIDESDIPF